MVFTCEDCGKIFETAKGLAVHRGWTHLRKTEKKKKKEKRGSLPKSSKNYLYVLLKQREETGYRNEEGDGSRYSGFRHTQRITEKIGPARISKSSPGWEYQDVYEVDPRIFILEPEHITLVYTTYYSGGTFGGDDGCVEFNYATIDYSSAEEWLKENKDTITKRHTGWGSRLTRIDIDCVHLWR